MTKDLTRPNSKSRRWIENFLVLAGVIAVSVWVWSVVSNAVFQDWESWVFDRTVRGERSTIGEYVGEKTSRIALGARAWLGLPATLEPSIPGPNIGPPAGWSFPQKDGLVGRLSIPRLHLRAMVREGTDEHTLALTVGHIRGTALPWQMGNVGVAGHRDTLFRGLRAIDNDDVILFETLAGNYVYKVENIEIVKPDNVSVLNASQYPELTLVTCYPFSYIGSAPERFIVRARRVSQSQTQQGLTDTPQETALHAIRPASAHQPRAAEHRPAIKRVTFEVSKGHSLQVSPGISLGLTGIGLSHLRVNGWIWLVPDRRTIWLRDQGTQDPVVFYGYRDGKRRELVITRVTTNSVIGYVMVPGIA
jgi:sortase A